MVRFKMACCCAKEEHEPRRTRSYLTTSPPDFSTDSARSSVASKSGSTLRDLAVGVAELDAHLSHLMLHLLGGVRRAVSRRKLKVAITSSEKALADEPPRQVRSRLRPGILSGGRPPPAPVFGLRERIFLFCENLFGG